MGFCQLGWGQIAYQGFEQNASDTWGITFSTPPCTSGGDVWDYSTTLGTLSPSAGSAFWGVQDLDGNCGSAAGETISFASTSVAGFTGVTIRFDYNIIGFDNGDDVFYTVTIDGFAQPQVQLVNGNSNFSTGGYVTETINIPPGTSTVAFELLVDQNGGGDRAAFDNFILDGTPSVGCPHSITAFVPESGPVGTHITITGTGFTGSSTVSFGGVAGTIISEAATKLVVEVPVGVSTSVITVTESGCDETTATDFTLLEESGTCGGVFSDLVISEVYDNDAGSLGYIEIFNGTGVTLDESDFSDYRIDRYNDGGTLTHSYLFSSSTPATYSVTNGNVLIFRIAANADVGTATADVEITTSTAGFNELDRLELFRISTSTVIDVFESTLTMDGYSAVRSNTISGPSNTYDASEWTQSDASNDSPPSTLGSFSPSSSPLPTITPQPSDQTSCSATFTVSATAGGGGALSYQWFYNDGAAVGWTAVPSGTLNGATIAGESTNTLSLSGNTSGVDGYQFYCQVTEGTCSTLSNAAQYNIDLGRYFRSRQTGNWSDVSTWEVATTSGGTYFPSCFIPNFSNSDEILIANATIVTITGDLTGADAIDQTTVNLGGTLILDDHALEFNDGTGVDFQVLGTYRDNSSVTITFNTATWSLGASGTYIKTNDSGLADWRDQYETGISNIPATASWYFQYEGNPLAVVAADNMFYPNLYFISNSGVYNGNTFSSTFRGSNEYATVKGNFEVGTQGTGSVMVYNNNTNSTPMRVLGNLVVALNSLLTNDSYNGSADEGTGFEVLGNVTIEGTLTVEDVLTTSATNVLILSGSTAQAVSGNGTFNIHDLIINNTSTNGVTLSGLSAPLEVQNQLNLTDGYVNTNATDGLLSLAADAAVVPTVAGSGTTAGAGSTDSFVNGPLRKIFSATEAGAGFYALPLGKNTLWYPAALDPAGAETFTTEFFANGYGDYTRSSCLTNVSTLVYWQIDRTGSENAGVRLYWKSDDIDVSSVLSERNRLTVGRFDGTEWEHADDPGNCANTDIVAGDETTGYVETDMVVTNFSPFTITSPIPSNVLPVSWLYFEGKCYQKNTAQLRWGTENERNNLGFYIEKSTDGKQFKSVGFIEAKAEQQGSADYQFVDQDFFEDSYYRLRQVDLDGTSAFSKVIHLLHTENRHLAILPNPSNGKVQLTGITLDTKLILTSTSGKVLLQASGDRQELENCLNRVLNEQPSGLYLLQIEKTGSWEQLKMVRW
ncbi:MAG: IPT/TIG domain-containing protein [Bacteroidota bacterium]